MKKFELVLLVMLLIHSFSVMIEAKQHVKTKSDWVIQRTPVDPEWLKVYVDDESKRLCLNFKDSFAPITVEVKDNRKTNRISIYNIPCCGRRVYFFI